MCFIKRQGRIILLCLSRCSVGCNPWGIFVFSYANPKKMRVGVFMRREKDNRRNIKKNKSKKIGRRNRERM